MTSPEIGGLPFYEVSKGACAHDVCNKGANFFSPKEERLRGIGTNKGDRIEKTPKFTRRPN